MENGRFRSVRLLASLLMGGCALDCAAQELTPRIEDVSIPVVAVAQFPPEQETVDEQTLAPVVLAGDMTLFDPPVTALTVEQKDFPYISFGDWLGYHSQRGDTTWLVGHGDEFGMFSLESFPTLELDKESAIVIGSGFHFLDGPVATDMPPRLYDFQIAYHSRATRTDNFVCDLKLGVGAFSDFEGSARKGIRFPGHAVGYYQWQAWLVGVLGIEVLDRDDVSLLPVAGWVWRPKEDLVFEFVFPRPKVQVKLTAEKALYLSGELGGDTWAVERSNSNNDVATYRDLRAMFGIVDFGDDDDSTLEIGWSFARALEYRSGLGNYHPDDAFIIRIRALY